MWIVLTWLACAGCLFARLRPVCVPESVSYIKEWLVVARQDDMGGGRKRHRVTS